MLRTLLLLSLTATLCFVPVVRSQNPPTSSRSPVINQTVFQTPAGKVTIYLPSDMAAGDTISGTVIAEPTAATDPRQQKKNSDELNGYVIELDKNHSRAGDKELRWKIPVTIPNGAIPLTLKDSKGKSLGETSIPISTSASPPPPKINIPNLAQAGRPVGIPGPFDGNAENTKVTIGDANAPVLAESPRQVVVQNPSVTPGSTSININENGAATSGSFRNLSIDLTAPKTSLLRGEKTELRVAVSGLEGLAETVPVRVRNFSPEVVELSGGNNQTVPVGPGTAPTLTFTRTLTGVSPGQFNIVADLAVPASNGGTIPSASPAPMPPPPPPSLPGATGGPTTNNPAPTNASGAPAPSPIKSSDAPNVPVEPVTGPAMAATPTPKENPCCKKIRDKNENEYGRRLLWREGNSDLEILGPFLFIRINGVEAKWKFDRNLEEVFCHLDKYRIDSEVKQVSETRLKEGKTTEKQEVISLLFTGPDPDNKSVRPNKFFQFMASKLDDKKVKEYAASVTVDEEACAWTLSIFGDNQLKEISSPPARQPIQIFDDLKADHDLEVAGNQPYTAGSWWSIKFRELSEIVQWCGWLKDHPDTQKSEEIRKAFSGWRINMRRALEDIRANGRNLSAEDRTVMEQMSKAVDIDDATECNKARDALLKFLPVWNRFSPTGAAF